MMPYAPGRPFRPQLSCGGCQQAETMPRPLSGSLTSGMTTTTWAALLAIVGIGVYAYKRKHGKKGKRTLSGRRRR